MIWFKRNPFIGVLVLTVVLVLGVEACLLRSTNQQARIATAQLEDRIRERDALHRRVPTPNENNETAITRELAGLQEKLVAVQATLTGGQHAISTPEKSVDAYFEITAFVEAMRLRAILAKVKIRPNEYFGFASHSSEGPSSELIETVFGQRIATEFLLDALLEACPEELFSLRRENPVAVMQRTARTQDGPTAVSISKPALAGDDAADFFEFPALSSVRKTGEIDSQAFELEFSGQTRVLRVFLSRLVENNNAVVVRTVEVDPIRNQAKASLASSSMDGSAVPIIAQDLSRFTVIVEFIAPAAADGRAAL